MVDGVAVAEIDSGLAEMLLLAKEHGGTGRITNHPLFTLQTPRDFEVDKLYNRVEQKMQLQLDIEWTGVQEYTAYKR